MQEEPRPFGHFSASAGPGGWPPNCAVAKAIGAREPQLIVQLGHMLFSKTLSFIVGFVKLCGALLVLPLGVRREVFTAGQILGSPGGHANMLTLHSEYTPAGAAVEDIQAWQHVELLRKSYPVLSPAAREPT